MEEHADEAKGKERSTVSAVAGMSIVATQTGVYSIERERTESTVHK